MKKVPESISDIKVFLEMAKSIVESFKPSNDEMTEEQNYCINNVIHSMDSCIELL